MDAEVELVLKALAGSPGLVLGAVIGKWGPFKRVATAPLCAMVFGVTAIAGVADAATVNLTNYYWLSIPFWAPFYVWVVRRPGAPTRVPVGGVGPASRAFETHRRA